jgi:hypothetical protein
LKTRSIGVLGASSFATAAAMFVASSASAQMLGLTATVRLQTDGNYLVNVWAVAGASTNTISSVSGGQNGSITTNAVGGFRQGTGIGQGLWAPSGSQNWTTLDSFLTCGGSLNTTTNVWTASSVTVGDANWNVTYFDTALGENATANSFNTPSNGDGFTNPNINTIPTAGGWFLGTSSPARSLASLTNRQNSSTAAAAGTFGMMLAQFYVSGSTAQGGGAQVFFNNMRIFFNSGNVLVPTFTINIPAPCALALFGMAGVTSRRRRT